MYLYEILLYMNLAIILILIVVVIWKNWKDINAFLFPSNWKEINMLTVHNERKCFLIKNPKEAFFVWNEGIYFMSDTEEGESTVYKSKKVNAYYYNEGNPFPLDFRKNKTVIDPLTLKKFEDLKLTGLYDTDENIFSKEMIMGILIGLMVGAVLMYISIKQGWVSVEVIKQVVAK